MLTYGQIRHNGFKKYERLARDIVEKVAGLIEYKYNVKDCEDESPVRISLMSQLPYVLYVCNGELEGKTIIDLGCGSISKDDQGKFCKNRIFEPWLCRTLVELDANVTGIDFKKNNYELFAFYQVDLFEKRLDFIDCFSADVVNASQLFNSPSQRYSSNGRNLRRILFPQVERILKPKGYFVYDSGK